MQTTSPALRAVLIVSLCVAMTDCSKEEKTGDEVPSVELMRPVKSLAAQLKGDDKKKVKRVNGRWQIRGASPLHVQFFPASGEAWDVSAFHLAGVSFANQGGGVATVEGLLRSEKPGNEGSPAIGFAVAPAGEKVTLGFPFPVAEDRYRGPEIFKDQLAKPNGHRVHWRRFVPEQVRVLSLNIRSSTGRVDLLMDDPFVAWPDSAELNQKLEAMPYLDALGQVRAVDWPGKAKSAADAKAGLEREVASAAKTGAVRGFSRYGGWLDGPKREATGHFRTEKIDGKWWLVDPEGHLFFSVGICCVGGGSETLAHKKRRDAGFFEFLPGDDAKDSLLRKAGLRMQDNRMLVNFEALNLARHYGDRWMSVAREGIFTRLQAWGVNTLGAWSDNELLKNARVPYTLTMWADPSMPSPFADNFGANLRKNLQHFAWAKDDPFCLGIFIGNEIGWPDEFAPAVQELPANHPTRKWVVEKLMQKYVTLEKLNAAWKTSHQDWNTVPGKKAENLSRSAKSDINPMYLEYATAYFARSKEALKEIMPHVLYLGCRTHRGPPVIGRAAAGHVDVFSVNVYDTRARAPQVPADADMPVLVSEFHFGAVDRGIPGAGLQSTWDQRQRGLAFCHYLASALVGPQFVGVHWFQWTDQPASGRSDRENHQVGFIDVTGRSYPDFVSCVSNATRVMYDARMKKDAACEAILEAMIKNIPAD